MFSAAFCFRLLSYSVPNSISKCALPVQIRLSELIEALDPELDSTCTSDLTNNGLSKLLWILARQKPCTTVSSLRCNFYFELNVKMRQKFLRLLAMPAIAEVLAQAGLMIDIE